MQDLCRRSSRRRKLNGPSVTDVVGRALSPPPSQARKAPEAPEHATSPPTTSAPCRFQSPSSSSTPQPSHDTPRRFLPDSPLSLRNQDSCSSEPPDEDSYTTPCSRTPPRLSSLTSSTSPGSVRWAPLRAPLRKMPRQTSLSSSSDSLSAESPVHVELDKPTDSVDRCSPVGEKVPPVPFPRTKRQARSPDKGSPSPVLSRSMPQQLPLPKLPVAVSLSAPASPAFKQRSRSALTVTYSSPPSVGEDGDLHGVPRGVRKGTAPELGDLHRAKEAVFRRVTIKKSLGEPDSNHEYDADTTNHTPVADINASNCHSSYPFPVPPPLIYDNSDPSLLHRTTNVPLTLQATSYTNTSLPPINPWFHRPQLPSDHLDSSPPSPAIRRLSELRKSLRLRDIRDLHRASDSDTPSRPTSQNSFDSRIWQLDDSDSDIQLGLKDKALLPDDFKLVFISSDSSDDESDWWGNGDTTWKMGPQLEDDFGEIYFEDSDWEFSSDSDGGVRVLSSDETSSSGGACSEAEDVVVLPPDELAFWSNCLRGGGGSSSGDEETRTKMCPRTCNQRRWKENGPETSEAESQHRPGVVGVGVNKISELDDPEQRSFDSGESRAKISGVGTSLMEAVNRGTSPPVVTDGTATIADVGRLHVGEPDRGGPCSQEAAIRFLPRPPVVDSLPEVGEGNGTDAIGVHSPAESQLFNNDAMVDCASSTHFDDSELHTEGKFSGRDTAACGDCSTKALERDVAADNDPSRTLKMADAQGAERREVGQQESWCASTEEGIDSRMAANELGGCSTTGKSDCASSDNATKDDSKSPSGQLRNSIDVSDRSKCDQGSAQQVIAEDASGAKLDTTESEECVRASEYVRSEFCSVNEGKTDSETAHDRPVSPKQQVEGSFDLEGMVVSTLERYFTQALESSEISTVRQNSLSVTWKRKVKNCDDPNSASREGALQSSEASDASCDEDEEAMFSDASTSSDDAMYISPIPKFNAMQYGNPLSYSLHTILEESCEESERGSRPTTPPAKNQSSELEKYFSFAIGNATLEELHKRWSVATSEEFSDTISETSGIDDVEVMDEDPAILASSRLEKYFTSGLLGAGTFNYPDDAEFTDESGGVSSDDDDDDKNTNSAGGRAKSKGSKTLFAEDEPCNTVKRKKKGDVPCYDVHVPLENESCGTIKKKRSDGNTELSTLELNPGDKSDVQQNIGESLSSKNGSDSADVTLTSSECPQGHVSDVVELQEAQTPAESPSRSMLSSVTSTAASLDSRRDSQSSMMESSTSGIESMCSSVTSLALSSDFSKDLTVPVGQDKSVLPQDGVENTRYTLYTHTAAGIVCSEGNAGTVAPIMNSSNKGIANDTKDEDPADVTITAEPDDSIDNEPVHTHSRSSSTGGYSDEEAAYIVNRVIAHISGMNEDDTKIDENVPPWKALLESQITRLMQTVSPAALSSESSSTIGSNNSDYGSDTLESGSYTSTDDEASPKPRRHVKTTRTLSKRSLSLEDNEKMIADNVSGHSTDSTISEETIFICKQLMQSLKKLSDDRASIEYKAVPVISDHNHNDYEKAQEYIQDQIVALMHTVSVSCNGSPLRERRGKIQCPLGGSAECSDIESPNLSEKKRSLGKTKTPSESGSETVSSSISIPSYDSDHTATESEVSHEMDELYSLLESSTLGDNISLSKLSCCDGEESIDHFLLPPSAQFGDPDQVVSESNRLQFSEQNCDLPNHRDEEKLPGMFSMSSGSVGKCDSSSTLTAGSDLDFCGSMETVLEVGPKPETVSPEPSTSPTEPSADKSRSESSLYIKARKGLSQRRLIVTRSSDNLGPYKRCELQLFRPSKSDHSLPDSAVCDDKDDNGSEASTTDDSLPSKRMSGKEKSSSENNLFLADFPKVRPPQKVSGTKSVGNIADIDGTHGSKSSCFRDTGYYSFKSSEESVLSLEEPASRPASASLTRQKSVPSSDTIPEVEEEPVRPARSLRPSSNCFSSSNIPETVLTDCKSSTLPSSLRSKVSRPSPHSSSMVLRQRHFSSTFFSTSGVLRKLTALKADDSSGSHRSSPRGRLRVRGRHSSGGSDDSARAIPVINVAAEEGSLSRASIDSSCAEGPHDERLDSVYPSCSRSQTSLSSIAPSRSESMTSVYSAAGRYGTVVVTGEAQFSLVYNPKSGMLEVHVKQCRGLAPVDTKKNRSDPYVKVYLLPDRTKSGKRKTKVKKNNLNPVFDEVLKFRVTMSELQARVLWLSVWHSDIFGRNDFLGEVMLQLSERAFKQTDSKWYPLQERRESLETPLSYKGDLLLSLKYMPPDVTNWASKLGSLHVLVKEARNLMATRSNGTADPFCKSYLLPDRSKSGKQKTPVMKKTCNPKWNHTFVYKDVSLDTLKDRCLELTLWDYDKYISNDFLGGVRLGTGTGRALGAEVDWMDSQGEEVLLWRTMLEKPNTWVEGKLQLRPNLTSKR
ncbi:uncharacterized protein LOC135400948 isoform X2 [Ornithodoros turicata]